MCGIFGCVSLGENSDLKLKQVAIKLAKLAESRGKDSSGLCFANSQSNTVDVYKAAVRIRTLLKEKDVSSSIEDLFGLSSEHFKLVFGHSRLVTNGSQLNSNNNQPVVKQDLIAIHNGIIVNDHELWEANQGLKREFEIDTEVFLALIAKNMVEHDDIVSSITKSISLCEGTISMGLFIPKHELFVLVSNNGSLYYAQNDTGALFFASERFMIDDALNELGEGKAKFKINQLNNTGVIIDLKNAEISTFDEYNASSNSGFQEKDINIHKVDRTESNLEVVVDLNQIHLNPNSDKEKDLLIYPEDEILKLKRCTTCILPETFPYIHFDSHGVCNYCNNKKARNEPMPIDALKDLVEPYKSKNSSPDVLVPFSGGRDSSFALHVIKEELGMNPITFTYDWGMVTDLARRNIARMCGKLNVENIIVSADIKWKRENVRKNIEAWLKRPDLGMIPLFMAGDKFFFYHANQIKKQTGIKLNIWGINDLENTDFKTGFAGLPPEFEKERIYSISIFNQLKLFGFVAKNMLLSPGYMNQSIIDSLGSFGSRYISPKKDYYHLFDYRQWDEHEIEQILFEKYNWEKSVDTDSTWRIGDGTASFYNYIYTLTNGFSENDTFRSNQIREGMITREKAMELVMKENMPRYNSLKWYLEVLHLPFERVINRVNQIPRFYDVKK